MKRINAYGGRALLWNTFGDGWYYEFSTRSRYSPPRRTALTTTDGKPLFVSFSGSNGSGYGKTMRDARGYAVSALRRAAQ